jgi:diamine N-acetyltransferase
MNSTPRLEEITPDNVTTACRIEVRPEQNVVAPVAWSLATAYAYQEIAWPCRIVDGDKAVGFLMDCFDTSEPPDSPFRCGLWRLNIAADHQGRGYGRFAVEAACQEARRRGEPRITVLWAQHEYGPGGFYLKLGFRPTGEVFKSQVVGSSRVVGEFFL